MHKTFVFWFWLIGFSVLALLLANVPLFNILGYEYSAIIALAISFVGAFMAITTLREIKRDPGGLTGSSNRVVLRSFWLALRINIVLLMAPLGIILLNAFRVQNCDISDGLLFFGLLPGISCLYSSAAGIFLGVYFQQRWKAYTTYVGYIFLTFVPLVINVVFHPPVFAYHATFGYFPGPIYDEQIAITPTLLIARTFTLLGALLFLTLAAVNCEISRKTALMPQFRWRNLLQFRKTGQIGVYLLAFVTLGAYFSAGTLGIRPTRGDIERKLGGFHETEHFEIYYDTTLENDIALIAADCEFQYSELTDYLGDSLQDKVRAYIYASPDQKKQLIGAYYTSVEDPFGHGFHIHAQGFPHPVLKHELAHVFTVPWSPVKVSLKIGLHEGIAVAADWDEGKLTGHQWAKAMHQLEMAPSLSAIMGIGFWGHAGARSYLLAGSFVRFLVDTYGIEKFKRVFPFGHFEKYYGRTSQGKDLGALEAEWLEFLKNVPVSNAALAYAKDRLKRGSIFEQTCAHEIAELRNTAWQSYFRKDFANATKTFERILSFEPGPGSPEGTLNDKELPIKPDTKNLRDLRGLMFSVYRMKDYERALSLANHLITEENARFATEARQLKGDIHWLRDEYEEARRTYTMLNRQGALALKHGTLQNNAIKRLAALSYPSVKVISGDKVSLPELLRVALIESNSTAEKMAYLFVCQQAVPDEWLAYFLAAELLHKEEAWDISNRYLQHAVVIGRKELEMIAPQLLVEAQRLTGINAYRLAFQASEASVTQRYKVSKKAFLEIAMKETLPLGTVMQAQTWIRRCQWAEKTIKLKEIGKDESPGYELEEP